MSDELKDFENAPSAPSLDFGTPLQADTQVELPDALGQKAVLGKQPILDDSMLNDQEKKAVEDFVTKIDLTNSKGILEYGAGTQKKMADFSERTLENVRSKDLGEIGELLGNVVTEVKEFDADEEEKGFFSFLRKPAKKMEAMKVKYDKAETNIAKITNALETHQITLLKDVAILDRMYDMNLNYYKELTMYILAGKKKLDLVRKNELAALYEKAKTSGLPEDAQAARDLDEICNRFEKKVHDLDLTRTISMQTAPQIRLIQNNNSQMAEKIQSTIVNTLPLWKNQMVISLGLEHSQRAAEAQRKVTDATNELLKKTRRS